ncbi:MAG TPA: energy transducer TonB [Candidatus Eisenbacteria bacterium]|nr:energy transducer TonB [Candidatus Eisenbacteria bacterium]
MGHVITACLALLLMARGLASPPASNVAGHRIPIRLVRWDWDSWGRRESVDTLYAFAGAGDTIPRPEPGSDNACVVIDSLLDQSRARVHAVIHAPLAPLPPVLFDGTPVRFEPRSYDGGTALTLASADEEQVRGYQQHHPRAGFAKHWVDFMPRVMRSPDVSGRGQVRVTVDRTGHVTHVVVESAASPRDSLALADPSAWRFRPAVREGTPVEMTVVVAVPVARGPGPRR